MAFSAIAVKQQQVEAEDLVLPIPAPVASSCSAASSFVTALADGHGETEFAMRGCETFQCQVARMHRSPPSVSSMSLAVAPGEVREIPGMGTFIETSHQDGTITR